MGEHQGMSRRSFVRSAALGTSTLGAVVAAGVGRALADEALTYADTVPWHYEADIAVVGLGGAGAAAAITSVEKGLETLVIEKAPEGLEGGNTHYCGQRFVRIEDADRAAMTAYMKELRGVYEDAMPDDVIDYLVDGFTRVAPWFEEHGGFMDDIRAEPEFADFEGSEVVCKNFPDPEYQKSYWTVVCALVRSYGEQGKLDAWFGSPAVDLVQDPITKAILGVRVLKGGADPVNVRTRKGVVLSCGSFESSLPMVQDYLRLNAVPLGTHYNTGDGIKMAQKVGADLWHMGNYWGSGLLYVNPDTGYAYNYFNSGDKACIYVGADGTRFMNEPASLKHGSIMFHGTWQPLRVSEPVYAILDEAAIRTSRLCTVWSEANQEEIDKGWFVRADDLGSLAEALGLDADGLEATVRTYNEGCETGSDAFGRAPERLIPFGEGPYYALPLTLALGNCLGGPRRNTACQVLDVEGLPIPGLCSAGELGSFFGGLYQGAGNVAECIMTGIDAVETLAAAGDVEAAELVFTWADQPVDSIPAQAYSVPEIELGEGQYLGYGHGISDLYVRVTMDGPAIGLVEVVQNFETPGIGSAALAVIPDRIVEAQSPEVDTVAGATKTSCGIMAAVRDALAQV